MDIRKLSILLYFFLIGTHSFGQLKKTIDDNSLSMLNIMPVPNKIEIGTKRLYITQDFSIKLTAIPDDKIIETASNRLLQRLNKKTLAYFKQESVTIEDIALEGTLSIDIKSKVETNQIGIDESYSLVSDGEHLTLVANTTLGGLRGMETVLQLVEADESGFYFPEVKIFDSPRFKWRGMMVDVARHFIPIDILKRNIDAMAMVKLNVLHLHLSDDEGFRVESMVFPKLHELGSNGNYYTQNELISLVSYAAEKGIMVYPEFDLPGHSTSWFAGYPKLASASGIYKAGHRFKIKQDTPINEAISIIMKAATPTLNPTKESTYKFIEKFVAEMTKIFPSPYFHIGADENNGKAWLENQQIVQFMKENNMATTHELQAYFVKRMHSILQKHKKTTIGWEELFDASLPKDVVVQVWGATGEKRSSPIEMGAQGNKVLMSKGFYLDYFYPASTHYLNSNIPKETATYILGGEAALWSELVDENSFEGRAWPRTAAIAERLWSESAIIDVNDMYRRLFVLSDRLQENGLNHQLNTIRLLSGLCNGQDVQKPLRVLETLAPTRGYGRLVSSFVAPERTKYLQVPLVDLRDLVSCDSQEAWKFRKEVEKYIESPNETLKNSIKQKLSDWKVAAESIPNLLKKSPNLKELNIYAQRILVAIDIAFQVIEKAPTENEQTDLVKKLKSLKLRGDQLEVQILPEIEALITRKILPPSK